MTQGQLELSRSGASISIAAPAAGVTLSGGGKSRVFLIDTGVIASLSNLTISGGSTTGNGGGLSNNGSMTLSECTISGNSVAAASGLAGGGGFYNDGTATLTNCTIESNSAQVGGGMDNESTATLIDCTVSGNRAGLAGGLKNSARAMLTDCTLSGNSAVVAGGGLGNLGNTALYDCTISGNTTAGVGGGLYISDGTAIAVSDCTISGNNALFDGGGVQDLGGTLTLTGSVVAANTYAGGASDINLILGGTVSGSYNLIGTGGSGGLSNDLNGNIVGVANPLLAPLANYGGSTQTMALLPGSPAIGAGIAVPGVTTDQRGIARPANDPDIGAFQDQGFSFIFFSGNSQTTLTGHPFNTALTVTVQSLASDPVAGGLVTFTAPNSGASAVLSAGTAPIGASGQAGITATANGSTGTYLVTAAAAGPRDANFTLTNRSGGVLGSAPGSVSTGSSLTSSVFVAGSTLYVIGGNTSNAATIEPAGADTDGSTGLAVSAILDGVAAMRMFDQPLTSIVILAGNSDNDFQLAAGLTLPVTVSAGAGTNIVSLGNESAVVVLGAGNDQISGGNGDDTVVAADLPGQSVSIHLGDGEHTIRLGGGDDNIILGDGQSVVVAGNGDDVIRVGQGSHEIRLGVGRDVVTAGEGTDIVRAGDQRVMIRVEHGRHTIRLDAAKQSSQPRPALRPALALQAPRPSSSNRGHEVAGAHFVRVIQINLSRHASSDQALRADSRPAKWKPSCWRPQRSGDGPARRILVQAALVPSPQP